MNVPIRMIGIAITFLWIFLVAFLASAVYSFKDLKFDFGLPQMSVTLDNKLLFSLNINIVNNGYYSMDSFNVTTEILDVDGFVVTRGLTFIPTIKKGENTTIFNNATFGVDDLLQINRNYLFDDSELRAAVYAGVRIAELIPVEVSTNLSLPWGAPFYNLITGQPERVEFNETHFRIAMAISFENHAFFNLTGNVQAQMYSGAGLRVGDGHTVIEAPQHSFYHGYVDIYVPKIELTRGSRFEVYFLTPFFDYGPLVVPYG